MAMRPLLGRIVLALGALLVGFPLLPASAKEEAGTIVLESGYPVPGIQGARSVGIRVRLPKNGREGRGYLFLNPNARGLSAFGDSSGSTLKRIRFIKVRFTRLRVKDARGWGRRVYRLSGKNLQGVFWLVVPGANGGGYRLLRAAKGTKPTDSIILEPAPKEE
jgi:hypothetical protein